MLLLCRWGHSAFVYKGQLWVYGGFDAQQGLDDLFRLDLSGLVWEKVQHAGVRPNRQLSRRFHAAALWAAGHSMLAFGKQVSGLIGRPRS